MPMYQPLNTNPGCYVDHVPWEMNVICHDNAEIKSPQCTEMVEGPK
jgi:hypothetical protein